MKILNLIDESKSDIKYKISKFPDGQQSITLDEEFLDTDDHIESINIKTRLNNFMDLEILICAVKALRTWGIFYPIDLYVPYFLGSRSDRAFGVYSPNYLRDVICPIINSLKFNSVTVIDPHSDVLEACLNNFKKVSNEEIVKFALGEIYDYDSNYGNSNMVLVSPDSGALKKIYKIADLLEFKGTIGVGTKSRDYNGSLSRSTINFSPIIDSSKDIVIIDDICDGGRTFIELAKLLKQDSWVTSKCKLYLIVTHGIFSKGFGELSKYFDHIYCTNSYSDLQAVAFENPNKINVEKLVTQLNVF